VFSGVPSRQAISTGNLVVTNRNHCFSSGIDAAWPLRNFANLFTPAAATKIRGYSIAILPACIAKKISNEDRDRQATEKFSLLACPALGTGEPSRR
jgi:hypothetical protein